VGAGTITCNYDGANKWPTEIGDGAFIGSGSMLVAPVRIGAGATVGAGSTITTNAPRGKLTLTRAPQVTSAAWTRPRKLSAEEHKAAVGRALSEPQAGTGTGSGSGAGSDTGSSDPDESA
jgi:bifunctional UDP-N-acetylglucosamine pyrophosphorylase/glucosamine-1-phosphate N-acetyltransferase